MDIHPGRASMVILAVASVGVGAGSTGLAQSPAVVSGGSDIRELVTFIRPSATSVGLTDWGRIKASLGAQDVTGASPIDAKVAVGVSTSQGEALASGFGLAHLRDHYATWAFDAMDLDWEATIQGDGPPLFVLRFRDGFDLAPVAALFDERGFTSARVPGATLRSHEMVLHEDWLTNTEFAILNTAFLDDGRTLVLSGDVDHVKDVAAHHGSFPSVPALDTTAAALEGASAALLLPGPATCQSFRAPPGTATHRYVVLGVGYARPGWEPLGRIVFGYPDTATATADLPGRLALATTGTSQLTGQRYADTLFRVERSHVDGADLTLEVAPVDDLPRHLLDMAFTRDMTFAGC